MATLSSSRSSRLNVIRPQWVEKLQVGAQSATYVRIQYELERDMVGGFACINYFFIYGGGYEFRMLVNPESIDTACVGVQLARNSSLLRGRACGRGQG